MKLRGKILKQEGNVTYVCFNPLMNTSLTSHEIKETDSLANVEE